MALISSLMARSVRPTVVDPSLAAAPVVPIVIRPAVTRGVMVGAPAPGWQRAEAEPEGAGNRSLLYVVLLLSVGYLPRLGVQPRLIALLFQ